MNTLISILSKVFRIFNTLLLAGILAMLVQIRQHMPPTTGEFRSANPQDKQALRLRQLHGPISVEIDNTPLSVEVDNEPLSVEIER